MVVVDDLHWGQPPLLDLLEFVADWVHEAPVLILCLARPELLDERPHWGGGRASSSSIRLEPLSEPETELLIERIRGPGALSDDLRRRIVETAEGNPLFVEQLLALATEASSGGDELPIPRTIQALLAARLDNLEREERETVDLAAVIGHHFSLDAMNGARADWVGGALVGDATHAGAQGARAFRPCRLGCRGGVPLQPRARP